MKRIIPIWNRIFSYGSLLFFIFTIWAIESEQRSLGNANNPKNIRVYIFLLAISIISIIVFYLQYIEYDEENDYVCYPYLWWKYKFKLSEVTFVGYLPFGTFGTYQISFKRFAKTKSFPIFCLFSKKKILELYEAAKRKNPNCVTDLKKDLIASK